MGKDQVKIGYLQDIALGFKIASECNWKIQEKKLNYKLGCQVSLSKSVFQLNLHDDNKVQVSLQYPLSQKLMSQFTAELSPSTGDLKYSLGFQVQE